MEEEDIHITIAMVVIIAVIIDVTIIVADVQLYDVREKKDVADAGISLGLYHTSWLVHMMNRTS